MFNFKEYKNLVYEIIGSAMQVHRELNWGLLEPEYADEEDEKEYEINDNS